VKTQLYKYIYNSAKCTDARVQYHGRKEKTPLQQVWFNELFPLTDATNLPTDKPINRLTPTLTLTVTLSVRRRWCTSFTATFVQVQIFHVRCLSLQDDQNIYVISRLLDLVIYW